MPAAGLIIVLFAIAMGVHAVRRGRVRPWLYIIAFVPLIGGGVYFVAHVLPELMRSSERRAPRPSPGIADLEAALITSNTARNREALARAYLGCDQPDDAAKTCEGGLRGVLADDPALTLLLARAHAQAGRPGEAEQHLDALDASRTDYERGTREALRVQLAYVGPNQDS